MRLSSSHKLFGNERETVDEAYPGDVIGLVGHDEFRHRRHADDRSKNSLQGNPALHAGGLCVSAQSEHGESTNNSARAWTRFCRKASSRRLYLRNSSHQDAAAGRRRAAAI